MNSVTRSLCLLSLLALPAIDRAQTKAPFEAKSGVFEHVEGVVKRTTYFDDFGLKQAVYTTSGGRDPKLNLDLPLTHKVEITLADGTRYDIDLDRKTGTSMKFPAAAAAALGAAMAPGLAADAKLTDLPKRQILGKPCVGQEVTLPSLRMVTRTWAYQGIPLRTEIGSVGSDAKPMVMEVTSLSLGPVPPEKFRVPPDVKVQNLSAN
jgi:hypothetical protein